MSLRALVLAALIPVGALAVWAACSPSAELEPVAGPSLEGVAVRGAGAEATSPAELQRIAAAALAHDQVEPPLISISVLDVDHAEVMTGEVRGPLDGGGHSVELERRDGEWVVVGVRIWIS